MRVEMLEASRLVGIDKLGTASACCGRSPPRSTTATWRRCAGHAEGEQWWGARD